MLSDCGTPEDLLGDEGLFKQLKKALLERTRAPRSTAWRKRAATSPATSRSRFFEYTGASIDNPTNQRNNRL